MNNDYKAMFAQVQSVHSANPNKLEVIMNNKSTHKIRSKPLIAALAVLLVAALSFGAYALVNLLSPAQVAREMGHDALAEVFENGDGVLIEKSVASQGYIFTLHGMATGENLLAFYEEVEDSKSILVLSVRREDGKPMNFFNPETVISDTYFAYCVVFDGYQPWQVSSRTIGGSGGQLFEKDGVLYVLLDCSNFEIFADRNPAFAVWNMAEVGMAPGADVFQMREDGSIVWADDMQAARAMFTLPLDPAKADPARVAQILEELENPRADGDEIEYGAAAGEFIPDESDILAWKRAQSEADGGSLMAWEPIED